MALSAPAVQGLGLVFHELLTNATRYGALSNETGYVEVRIERSLASIAINWKERGGPLVGEEDISGFGTKLMSKAVAANGTVKLSFLPDGLECHIDLTLN
ncbi:hypothetical protein GCM10010990_34550 [Croceicoccus mobilis]|uniref:histidine kinase n=2 Tax=Croceicoccus mobilis TaxID=1703339 RepID=A0A916Z8I9_9SPHN|nr:hypothetical protein GCM10010990_34550 [Croceicoccus mobilis]